MLSRAALEAGQLLLDLFQLGRGKRGFAELFREQADHEGQVLGQAFAADHQHGAIDAEVEGGADTFEFLGELKFVLLQRALVEHRADQRRDRDVVFGREAVAGRNRAAKGDDIFDPGGVGDHVDAGNGGADGVVSYGRPGGRGGGEDERGDEHAKRRLHGVEKRA